LQRRHSSCRNLDREREKNILSVITNSERKVAPHIVIFSSEMNVRYPIMEKDFQFQIWFMPWLGLGKTRKIGNCSLIPFKEFSHENLDLIKRLSDIFTSYVDDSGKTVDSVCIAVLDEAQDLHQLCLAEQETLRLSVDMYLFSVIASGTLKCLTQGNWQLAPPSSERFQLFGQQINLESTGYSIRTRSVQKGYGDFGSVVFQRPLFLGGSTSHVEEDVLAASDTFLRKTKDLDSFESRLDQHIQIEMDKLANVKSRMAYALEWYRLAHLESWDIAAKTVISFLASGIESACGISANKVKTAQALNKLCRSEWTIENTRNIKKKDDKVPFTASLLSWWFLEFYDLRSDIIHGGKLQNERFLYTTATGSKSHAELAAFVLTDLILRVLNENNCFDKFSDTKMCLNKVYHKLGWSEKAPMCDPVEIMRIIKETEQDDDQSA
jgi:hypothetical protein